MQCKPSSGLFFASISTLFFAAILRRFSPFEPFLRLFCGDFASQIWKIFPKMEIVFPYTKHRETLYLWEFLDIFGV